MLKQIEGFTFYEEEDCIIVKEQDVMIGKLHFVDKGDAYDVDSTHVDPNYRGHKLARHLVDLMFEKARVEHKKIIPTCSYVEHILNKDEAYKDLRR